MLDHTGFCKTGRHSAGVARPYRGGDRPAAAGLWAAAVADGGEQDAGPSGHGRRVAARPV